MRGNTCCVVIGMASLAWTGASGTAEQPAIALAPAFTPADLMARPTTNWITNGGTLYNKRYSPLTRINRDNVTTRSDAPGAGGRGDRLGAQAAAPQPNKPVDLAVGAEIYKVACLACHGADGTGGHSGGPTLIGKLDAGQIRAVTASGKNNMQTFRGIYDANQIRDVAEHIVQQLEQRPSEMMRCKVINRAGYTG